MFKIDYIIYMKQSDIYNILSSATISNNVVKLNCGQVDRGVYIQVDEILKRLWGKWNKRKGGHVFEYDPTDMIQAYIETGKLPPKNETAYFPTPLKLVEEIIRLSKNSICWDEVDILEPSAGQGAFLDIIKKEFPNGKLTCVEYLELNATVLKNKGYNPIVDDFMEVVFNDTYDLIIMNPPFSLPNDKKAYISHIMKAHSLMNKDGVLFAIAPKGWIHNSTNKEKEFKEFVSIHADFVDVYDRGTFKESGTMVETTLICLKSSSAVNEFIGTGYYEEQFYHYMLGNIDFIIRREAHLNKNELEYFKYVVEHSRNMNNYIGGLPDGINETECINLIKEFDSEL